KKVSLPKPAHPCTQAHSKSQKSRQTSRDAVPILEPPRRPHPSSHPPVKGALGEMYGLDCDDADWTNPDLHGGPEPKPKVQAVFLICEESDAFKLREGPSPGIRPRNGRVPTDLPQGLGSQSARGSLARHAPAPCCPLPIRRRD